MKVKVDKVTLAKAEGEQVEQKGQRKKGLRVDVDQAMEVDDFVFVQFIKELSTFKDMFSKVEQQAQYLMGWTNEAADRIYRLEKRLGMVQKKDKDKEE